MKIRVILIVFALFLSLAGFALVLREQRPAESPVAPDSGSSLDVTLVTAPIPESQPEEPKMSADFDRSLPLWVKDGDGVQEMSLQDYLLGVLLAEMPADFSEEALKAQAVASRTYTLRKAAAKKHNDADICTASSCCQAWKSTEKYLADGGTQENVDKLMAAIEETDALVVTYAGKLIDATFFSCAGGSTEAAAAVWGSDIPYLQAVSSPEEVPRYSQTVSIDSASFAETLLSVYPEADLSGSADSWFGAVVQTPGGGIGTISIGGAEVSGTQLRRLFSLRSTDITIATEGNDILFSTNGYGHRVGLSQYGADAMAQTGCTFEQILLHYYQGTQIQRLVLTRERSA